MRINFLIFTIIATLAILVVTAVTATTNNAWAAPQVSAVSDIPSGIDKTFYKYSGFPPNQELTLKIIGPDNAVIDTFQLKGTTDGSGNGDLNHGYNCNQGIYVNLISGNTSARGSIICGISHKK
jgi:hypothetical protein